MTRNQQFLMIVCALLLVESGEASANVITTNPTDISNQTVQPGSPFTLTFSTPVSNATELVSIGGGTVFANESGDFLIDVKYSNGTTQQIFSDAIPIGTIFDLDTITDKTFTEGTVTGLVFDASTGLPPTYGLTISAGTDFTFATATAAPEPKSLTLFGTALALLTAVWRRRMRRGSSTA